MGSYLELKLISLNLQIKYLNYEHHHSVYLLMRWISENMKKLVIRTFSGGFDFVANENSRKFYWEIKSVSILKINWKWFDFSLASQFASTLSSYGIFSAFAMAALGGSFRFKRMPFVAQPWIAKNWRISGKDIFCIKLKWKWSHLEV